MEPSPRRFISDSGVALSPDGELIGVVEENDDDRLEVTLLDARDGRERWRTTLHLRNNVPSAQVSVPVMFSTDGASLHVGGAAVLRPPPAQMWVDIDVTTGRAGGGTAVDLLGGTNERQVSTAGISKGLLWSGSVIRFSESHTSPGVRWSCDYSSVELGRDKLRFQPERDTQLRVQVTGREEER